jgi:hypothetical protein
MISPGTLAPALRRVSELARLGQQAAERGRGGALDLKDLGAARGSGDQRDGPGRTQTVIRTAPACRSPASATL